MSKKSPDYALTHKMLQDFGLNETDLSMIQSGDVGWDILEGDLTLIHHKGGTRRICQLSDTQISALLNTFRYEFRSGKTNAPSAIFTPGTVDDWAGVAPNTDWANYVKGYKDAAMALGSSIANDFIEPYLFLCRHTIELMLKAIIMLGQEYMDVSYDLPGHHDLDKLWTSAVPFIMCNTKIKRSELLPTETVVKEYHKVDQGSFAFRYPVGKDNAQIRHKEHLQAFSISHHDQKFRSATDFLTNSIDFIKIKIVFKGLGKLLAQIDTVQDEADTTAS